MIIWVIFFISYITSDDFCANLTRNIGRTAILCTILWNSMMADF
jgi:hypothetical protein